MRHLLLLTGLLTGLLAACQDRDPDAIELTAAEQAEGEAAAQRVRAQPDPVAVAVGMKHGIGPDTVLAVVSDFALHHDGKLLLDLYAEELVRSGKAARPLPSLTGQAPQPPHQTRRQLAHRYQLPPALVGELVYDYKQARP